MYASNAPGDPQVINSWTRTAVGNWSVVAPAWDFANDPPGGMTSLAAVKALCALLRGGAAPYALMAEAGSLMLGTPGFNLMI